MKLLDRIASRFGFARLNGNAVQKERQFRDPAWAIAKLKLRDAELDDPYTQHAWVYSCIKRIAVNVAQVPFRLYTGTEDEPTLITDGPMYDIFERPNKTWTKYHLWESIVTLLSLRGNAVWVIDRTNERQEPEEIWTFSHSKFKPKLVGNTLISYEFRRDSHTRMILKPHEVLVFRYYNPEHSFWGVSPLEAARQAAEQDHLASQFNRAFFENGANPGGIMTFPDGIPQQEIERYRSMLEARHQGAERAFKTMIFGGQADYKQLEIKHKDMDFLAQKKWSREAICACFGVPKAEIQVYEDINYATALSTDRSFWQKTLIPIMRLIEATLRAQFFIPYDGGNTWGKFDCSAIPALQEDLDKQVERATKLFGMGIPFNKINERLDLGFEDVEGGDTGYLPISLIPAGTEPPQRGLPAPEPEKTLPLLSTVHVKEKPIHTPSQAEYWKTFVRVNKAAEQTFQRSMRKYVGEVKTWANNVLSKYRAPTDIPATEFDIETKFNQRLQDLAEDNYYKVVNGYAPTIERNIQAAGYQFKFDVSDPRIVGYVEGKVNKVVQINETMRDQIKGAIEDALTNNETIGELQNRISTVMGDTRARSLRIARTETSSAANGVEFESYRQAGVQEKMWIASLDEVTRDSHIEAMGQGNIPTNQVFSNGLMFPGEPSAPVEEIVNCRCTLMATG